MTMKTKTTLRIVIKTPINCCEEINLKDMGLIVVLTNKTTLRIVKKCPINLNAVDFTHN